MPRFKITDIPKTDRRFYTPQIIHDIRSTPQAEQESPTPGRPVSGKYDPQQFWHYHNPSKPSEAFLIHPIPQDYKELKLNPEERYFYSFLQDSFQTYPYELLEYMGRSEFFSIYHVLPTAGQVETTNRFISRLLDNATKTRRGVYLIPTHSQAEMDILQNMLVDARYRDKEFADGFAKAFYTQRPTR